MVHGSRALGVVAALVAALGLSVTVPAGAREQSGSAPGDGVPDATDGPFSKPSLGLPGGTEKVTLLTGDEVWLTRARDASGRSLVSTRIVEAPRPGGEEVSFVQWGTAERYYVVPSDVLPLVDSRLDRDIFDVAGRVDSGADPSSTRVIVSFSPADSFEATARSVTQRAKLPRGTLLPSAGAVALSVPPGRGGRLLEQLGPAKSGVARVSLDQRVEALDSVSMPQIGAGRAWKAGFTGKGVTVAVLDTGIDASHPDLKGRVAAAKNFTDTKTATDLSGHGTHVASIIGGSGAASGPSMRGVAYEANLLNGKVLSDTGAGYTSDVIEGMEWAAKSGADVINMSLGGGPGDGTSPIEKSLNTLSRQYGVLFAVAAGNGGRGRDGGVTSPSTADAAISVAAVDSRNRVASFSDSGPRSGDYALKPDVAAPGVDIRGARSKVNGWASGSSPYVRLSGTSMATPHVAGAAALLAQARPDLSPPELKSTLMGGATDRPGNVWQEGAGVVNIPAAIDMPVIAREGSLSYGLFTFPQSTQAPATRTIHYRNTSGTPVTLRLAAEAAGPTGRAARGIALSTREVTVPARGAAAVRITLTPGADPPGRYAGAITARPNRGHAIRTTLGWVNDPQRFKVTINALDHRGKPGDVVGIVGNLEGRASEYDAIPRPGAAALRLPAGRYFVGGYVYPKGTRSNPREITLGIKPEVRISSDTTIALGGPSGRRPTVLTPKPSVMTGSAYSYERETTVGDGAVGFVASSRGLAGGLWVTPAAAPTIGRASFLEQVMLAAPGKDPPYDYQLAFPTRGRISKAGARRVSPKKLAASVGTYRSPVADATATSHWRAEAPNGTFSTRLSREVRAPGTVTSYVLDNGTRWINYADGPRAGYFEGELYGDSGWRTVRAGTTRRTEYFSPIMSPGAVTGGAAFRERNLIGITMPHFEDSDGHVGMRYTDPFDSSLTAYVGSRRVLSTVFVPSGQFRAPSGGGTLRIVQKERRRSPTWKTATAMTGEWTAPLPTRNSRVVPLLNVGFRLDGQSATGAVPPGAQTIGLSVSTYPDATSFRKALTEPKSLTLDWSIDGGLTWKRARVARVGKAATATFTPPAAGGDEAVRVSLRATASDVRGSTVTETLISAYEVSGFPPDSIAARR